MEIGILDFSRGRAARSARVAHNHEVDGSNPSPATRFLPQDMLESARDHATWNHDNDRRGTAVLIRLLVADIEKYREAFKGATSIINRASQLLQQKDSAIAGRSRELALAQLKLTSLFITAAKLQPFLDEEIEQRQHGGNGEDWAALQALSDELHATLKLVTP